LPALAVEGASEDALDVDALDVDVVDDASDFVPVSVPFDPSAALAAGVAVASEAPASLV
jgi:hypothetical protein